MGHWEDYTDNVDNADNTDILNKQDIFYNSDTNLSSFTILAVLIIKVKI